MALAGLGVLLIGGGVANVYWMSSALVFPPAIIVGGMGLLLGLWRMTASPAPGGGSAARWLARIAGTLVLVLPLLAFFASLGSPPRGIPVDGPPPGVSDIDLLISGLFAAGGIALVGLGLHLRRLLRPGTFRWVPWFVLLSGVGLLVLVVGFIGLFSYQDPIAAAIWILMLPIVFSVPGYLLIALIGLRRAGTLPPGVVPAGLSQGIEQAGGLVSRVDALMDGPLISGLVEDRPFELRLDTARLPIAFELRVLLPEAPVSLSLQRRREGPPGLSSGDPILDRLLWVGGLEPQEVPGLLAEMHSLLLPVLEGRPGSVVEDGAIVLKEVVPRLSRKGGVSDEQLASQVEAALRDASALAEALSQRFKDPQELREGHS